MANDLFGSFGGLMKGLSSLMPQDDPNTKLFNMHTEVSALKKQEHDLYIEIGKAAVEQYGLEIFGETAERLKLVQANLAAAEAKLKAAEEAQKQKEEEEEAALAARTCSQCGHENPEGTKFCQECGSKIGVSGSKCPSCGADNQPGVKFCQQCGCKMKAAPAVCPECSHENAPGTRFCGGCGTRLEA